MLKDGSVRRAEILGDIIDRYNEEISQGLYIEDKIVKWIFPRGNKNYRGKIV